MSNLSPFRMTERDAYLLRSIARFRFLSTPQLQGIAGGSARGVRNRLRSLCDHGYLRRVTPTVIEPFAYALTSQGARYLARHDWPIDAHLDWTAKNERTQFFIAHTVAIAETVLQFENAARKRDIRFLDQHELLADMPEPTGAKRDPLWLQLRIAQNQRDMKVSVRPDRVIVLETKGQRFGFALEVDRGTMDIWATHLVGKASIRRKLMTYMAARQKKLFRKAWGLDSLRILTVTTSATRIASMLAAQRRVDDRCPPGLFLYATFKQLGDIGPLGPIWTTAKRSDVSLLH